MLSNLKDGSARVALVCFTIGLTTDVASAVSPEVAKKCSALTAKAFPPREVGNPAAGSAKGSGADEQDYFRKCVANGGKPDEDTSKQSK
jgi:hypothetical protein